MDMNVQIYYRQCMLHGLVQSPTIGLIKKLISTFGRLPKHVTDKTHIATLPVI